VKRPRPGAKTEAGFSAFCAEDFGVFYTKRLDSGRRKRENHNGLIREKHAIKLRM
jgi:hypothetical protein